mmetsp:Transcript_17666/g.48019  ORF Transcript_17666/g.48019 Transcript_17666/m.48019 type:complete len:205 (-) Transcript_17666:625-1239(-)
MATDLHWSSGCDSASSSRCSQRASADASAARSKATCGSRRLTSVALTAPVSTLCRTSSLSSRGAAASRLQRTRLRIRCRTPHPSRSPCWVCPSAKTACGCSAWRTTACGRCPRSCCLSTSMASPSYTRRRSALSRCRHSPSSALAASMTTSAASTSRTSSASRSRSLHAGPCFTSPWARMRATRSPRMRRGSGGPWTSLARCSW